MEVSKELISKNDGRKKAWWIKRIEQLEAELEVLRRQLPENGEQNEIDNLSYAEGFVDCLHKFQILSKVMRKRLHTRILQHGPGEVKNMHGPKFRGLTL